MELSDRKRKILTAIVEGYVATAEPVGSKALAEVIGCSSATIRNEMAELTTMGYLEQPHTSSGRIPSPAGYRLYVNELMEKRKLSEAETAFINDSLEKKEHLDDLMSDVGQLTSSMTQYPAYAMTMRAPATIKRFDFIYVDANTFIIVALMTDNTVKNKLIHLPFSVHQDQIQTLSSLFNAHFTNVTEKDITDVLIRSTERAAGDTYGLVAVVAAFALEILSDSMKAAPIRVAGASNLLDQPEFRDPDKAHALMNFISDGSHLMADLPTYEEDGLRVTIGPENLAEELRDSSVVMASYDAGGGMRGYIGVVGPTRMDYSNVAAKLSYIAAGLSRMFAGSDAPEGLNNKLVLKEKDDNE